ncbi:MAG: hypothetical protein OEV42_18015 [Deltaproteobacteria bacterium]|nr:hypothetical protein [Deltaproteobacteria bacterium]
MSLVKDIKKKMEEFEADGRHCMGIHLTSEMAAEVRKELQYLYGKDLGIPTLLFGREILSVDATELSFEE